MKKEIRRNGMVKDVKERMRAKTFKRTKRERRKLKVNREEIKKVDKKGIR